MRAGRSARGALGDVDGADRAVHHGAARLRGTGRGLAARKVEAEDSEGAVGEKHHCQSGQGKAKFVYGGFFLMDEDHCQ